MDEVLMFRVQLVTVTKFVSVSGMTYRVYIHYARPKKTEFVFNTHTSMVVESTVSLIVCEIFYFLLTRRYLVCIHIKELYFQTSYLNRFAK